MVEYLTDRQIISIVGLRRTGKTILLKQLIRHLIDQDGVDPRHILFVSFDEALVTSTLTLERYIETYLEYVDVEASDSKRYIFFDEIQYIPRWQHILKRYYDTRPNLKFVLSGSSSLFLKKKTVESLAGRIYEFTLSPLSFGEFLELAEVSPTLLREYQTYSVPVERPELQADVKEYELLLARSGSTFSRLFEEYLLYYQFPEMIGQRDTEKIIKYITEAIYKKTIEYDIPRLFGVEKVAELKFLFHILVQENGSLLEFKKLSSEAGIEENTLKKYLSYFQESFLVDVVYNYSRSFRKSKRLQKKAYVSSTNFFAALRRESWDDTVLKAEYLGMLAETHVFSLLRKRYQYLSFYRKGSAEIDFVVSQDYRHVDGHRLIEVKYVNVVSREDIRFIDRIAVKKFCSAYTIYTKKEVKADTGKIYIPCFLLR